MESASGRAADRRHIEDLTRQLDHALRELALNRRGIEPRAAGHDYPHPCFVCHRRPPEAKGMVTASRRQFTLFICRGCIEEMRQLSDRIIAGNPGGSA
jgi:hypothetical protein